MNIGDKVRNKKTGTLGTIVYSTFGVSVSGINEDNRHWQTLGASVEETAQYWEVVEDE